MTTKKNLSETCTTLQTSSDCLSQSANRELGNLPVSFLHCIPKLVFAYGIPYLEQTAEGGRESWRDSARFVFVCFLGALIQPRFRGGTKPQ